MESCTGYQQASGRGSERARLRWKEGENGRGRQLLWRPATWSCSTTEEGSTGRQKKHYRMTALTWWVSTGQSNVSLGYQEKIHFLQAVKIKLKVKSLSRVLLFATPWTVAHQAPPSTGSSRQEEWSGLLYKHLLWTELCPSPKTTNPEAWVPHVTVFGRRAFQEVL